MDHQNPLYRVDRWCMVTGGWERLLYGKMGRDVSPQHTQVVIHTWHEATKFLGWRGKLTAATSLLYSALLPEVTGLNGFHK